MKKTCPFLCRESNAYTSCFGPEISWKQLSDIGVQGIQYGNYWKFSVLPLQHIKEKSFPSSVFRSHLIETTIMQEKNNIVYPLEGH